jgi:hypothetical protein
LLRAGGEFPNGLRGMFKIARRGLTRRRRLIADTVLQPGDFDAIAAALGVAPVRARKIAYVAASRATEAVTVETRWHGEVTKNDANVGDWIVTNLDTAKSPLRDADGSVNRYVIRPEAFARLYERAVGETQWGAVFKGKGVVDALLLSGGLDIKAPWGERQTIERGYLLRSGADIYGNDLKSFRATYEVLS